MASDELYQEFWHSFCDQYLEQVKPRIYSKDKEGNPAMKPFWEITEEEVQKIMKDFEAD